MVSRDVILTEYRADNRSFRRAASQYDRTLRAQERLTNNRLGRIDQRWERSTRSILNSRTALAGLSGLVGGRAIGAVREYGEEWRQVERSLAAIGETSREAQQDVLDLAIRTRAPITGIAASVRQMSRSTDGDLDSTIRRVQTLQQLLAVQGASGSERNSVTTQLGQALQSGVLSGDEFRSLRENAPIEFLDALAEAAGVTRAGLRAVAEDQRLTTDIVLTALDSLADASDAAFSQMSLSGEEAFNVLRSGMVAYAGQVDDTIGFTDTLNGMIASLGEYAAGASAGAETMARAIQVIAVASVTTAGSRGLGALRNAYIQGAIARRQDVVARMQQEAASRRLIQTAQAELQVARERVSVAALDVQRRRATGAAIKAASTEYERAIRGEIRARDALRGANSRAIASTSALATAQARLSVATRISTLAQRSFNSVLAFFGGPIGLALVAITAGLTLMATRTSEIDGLTRDLTDRVNELTAAWGRAQGNVENVRQEIGAMSVAQAILETRAWNGELEDARRNAVLAVNGMRAQLSGVVDPDLFAVLDQFVTGQTTVQEFQAAINEMAASGSEALVEFAILVERSGLFEALIDAETGSQRANDVLLVLTGTSDQAAAAMARLAPGLDAAAASAGNLAGQAGAAVTGIDGLIARIPELARVARIQANIAEAALERDRALSEIPDNLPDGARLAASRDIFDLFDRAVSEIDGTAQSIRDADTALEDFTDSSYLGSLSAQERAIAQQTRSYEELRQSMIEAGNTQVELDQAAAAQAQALANIEEQFASRGGAITSEGLQNAQERLNAVRELLIENGQRELFIERALNIERARLRELLPILTSMGLSRADAEAVLAAQLERTHERLLEVRSASEEAAAAFAKNILQDIRAANSLEDAISRISERLLDLAFDRAFDLLAAQFARLATAQKGANGGNGGWLSQILGALLPQFAGGGRIRGPGGPTEDRVPIMASDGEFMVRAASVTPQTLPYLEAINRGAIIPRFAQGGRIGGGNTNAASPRGGLNLTINNYSRAQVEAQPSADGKDLVIVIEDVVKGGLMGGRYDTAMGQRYAMKAKPRGGA